MELKVLKNEEILKNPYEIFITDFEYVDEGDKVFLRKKIGDNKEARIFFKKLFYETPQKRKELEELFKSKDIKKITKFFDNAWIVKSKKSGVLLLVPKEFAGTKKEGFFVIVSGEGVCFPTSSFLLYYKQGYMGNIFIYYLKENEFFLYLGKDIIKLIINNENKFEIRTYKKI